MTRKFYQIGIIIAIAATFFATPSYAGSKERDFLKKLLFPPIPVPVPGKKKFVDLNEVFREGRVPLPPTPRIVVPPRPRVIIPKPPKVVIPPTPRVSITINRNEHHSSHRSRHNRHNHHVERPRVHTCCNATFSRTEPPNYRRVSCSTLRPSVHHVWIEGRWQRNCCGWKWVNGRWTLPPTKSAFWVAGYWTPTYSGWQWVEGGWNTASCY